MLGLGLRLGLGLGLFFAIFFAQKTLNSTQYIYVGGTVSSCLLSVNVIVNRFYIALFTLYHILYH